MFFRKGGTGHSPQTETEIELPDHENLVDDVETAVLLTHQELSQIVRFAAHHTLKAIADRPEGGGTGQLADLVYAFACLEGARSGVLPGTPPPRKHSAPTAVPPRTPSGPPQFGDTTRTNR